MNLSIRDIIRELEDSFRPTAIRKGLSLEIELASDLPVIPRTEASSIRQILTSLVSNAIKFTSSGSVSLRAYRDRAQTRDRLCLDVSDTGPGIDEEMQRHVIELLGRKESRDDRPPSGKETGLPHARTFARLIGAQIELVRSEKDQGSTFRVCMSASNAPLMPATSDTRSPAMPTVTMRSRTPAQSASTARLDGMDILVVDDLPDNVMIVSCFLKHAGAGVRTACNGLEAIQRALEKKPDLVLMDIQMPEMDGVTATSVLRANGFDRPIVALTAHGSPEEVDSFLRAGCTAHIAKPVNRFVLMSRIAEILGCRTCGTSQAG